jgi:drug/metabolite transporter (DMT)-like permease
MPHHFRVDRSSLLGIAAILLWSATVALARSISERIGPLTAGAAVYLGGSALLAGSLLARRRSLGVLRQLPARYLFGCGALFVLYTLSLFLGLGLAASRPQAIEVALLNYLWPALTILFSLVLLGKRATLGLIPGSLLALAGVCLVLAQGAAISWRSFSANLLSNPAAYGLGALAAVTWALYSNLTRRWGGSDSQGAVLLFTLGTGLAFLLMGRIHPEAGAWGARVAAEVACLALATAAAYVFWDIAMREGDMVLVASCSYLTPFFSTVVSCLYLRVWPTLSLWVGCLLIIAGSFLSWRAIREPAGEPPGPAVRQAAAGSSISS